MRDNEKPLVSICCITYNHEPYIRDCLEGFVMQRTDFPFEVLIHDDASTDRTADIIREYGAKYPDIIKAVCQTENQYSKGVNVGIRTLDRAQGKYIAFCEGDDFWCDPQKLQMQFDFLESHPDYSACFCGQYVLNEFEHRITPMGFPSADFPTDMREAQRVILSGQHPFCTAANFFRTSAWKDFRSAFEEDTKNAPMGDRQLFFHLAGAGKIEYIRRRMVVYRRHGGSVCAHDVEEKQHRFHEATCNAIIRMARKYGFDDIAEQTRPYREATPSPWRGFLRKLKCFYRGDYRVWRKYMKSSGRDRLLCINDFCPK